MKIEIVTKTILDVREDGTTVVIDKNTEVRNVDVQLPTSASEKHKLNVSEKRYGILTFSRKGKIAEILPLNTDITVIFDGVSYAGHSHSQSRGRIDRLSGLIRNNFNVGTEITAIYDDLNKTLIISKLNEEENICI